MVLQAAKRIYNGESEIQEFKLNFNDDVIITISAFANTSGGSVFIGVDDTGQVMGVSIGKETLQNWINEIKNKTKPSLIPDINELKIDNKTVVEIKIGEYPVKPIAFKGRYFKRVKNSNQRIDVPEIADIYLKSIQTSWDAYPYPGAILNDLDFNKVENFIQKVNNNGRFSLKENASEALRKLHLINNDEVPTNAAMLMFSKADLNFNVHAGRFKTPSMIINDKIFRGGLFDVVEDTMRYILGEIKVAFEITGNTTQRDEIFEYPIPALRELVLNAIVHRDYTSPVDIQVKIFDQEITIFNPGRLYGNLTIDDLKTDAYQSHARNKLIAEAFYLTKDIEKYGSGFIRIRHEVSQYPTMEFVYSEVGTGFLTTLRYKQQRVTRNVTENVTENVTDSREIRILNLMKKNNRISTGEMARNLNVSRMTIAREISSLKKQGLIIRIGSAKGGHWEVVGD